jgi:hypothetical protein
MEIINVPSEFQPIYKSDYPSYTNGNNIEEIFFDFIKKREHTFSTDFVYLPVFWTSFYLIRNWGSNIDDLYDWLSRLDRTKKYFTFIQYDMGIFIKNYDLNIIVFSAGGGGLNMKNENILKEFNYFGSSRQYFCGKKGNYDIPLLCLPLIEPIIIKRDIIVSFMGRIDTHFCRLEMYNKLKNNTNFVFIESSPNINTYREILSRSIFTLAPRGFGYTSFRLFEAILCGSIPIYIWEGEIILPFQDIICWNDFSIIIHISDIDKLNEIISNCDISKMQNNINKVKQFLTIDFIINNIFTTLQTT